jgi:hypothetical protein
MVASGYGAVDKVSKSGDTMTGQLVVPDVSVSGLTGMTAASRYVGAIASGTPGSGTFVTGDWGISQTGQVIICTAGGTPGTWVVGGGGMSNPMTTLGDVLYENATPAAARLAGNTTTTKKYLTQTGTGSASAAPAWGTIAAADVPTLNQNTSGTAGNITGVAAIANGGTGQATAYAAAVALGVPVAIARGSVTLANSTTVTNIAVGSVPGNDPITDAIYRIRCWGLFSTTGSPSLTFSLAWGATTLIAGPAVGMGTGVSNQQFYCDAEVHFTSTTQCASIMNMTFSIVALGFNSASSYIDQAATQTVTVTPAQNFAFTAKWSAASASNTLTSRYLVQRV